VALENIVRSQKYPCANRQNGCLDRFSIEHIAEHHTVCVYGKIKCPLHLLKICSWNGLKNDLKEHAKAAHPNNFLELSTFSLTNFSRCVVIVSYFGELFTYYQKINEGRNYAAVQLIGKSSEASKYKCHFTLRAANGIEQICNTFLVQGYSEDWETIFNSGIYFCLDEKTVKHFLKENKVKLTVTLSRVILPPQPPVETDHFDADNWGQECYAVNWGQERYAVNWGQAYYADNWGP
jgi:hypothetical protein